MKRIRSKKLSPRAAAVQLAAGTLKLEFTAEAKLFKDAHGVLVRHTRKVGHNSDGHFGFADLEELGLVRFRREPFSDRLLDVGQGVSLAANRRQSEE